MPSPIWLALAGAWLALVGGAQTSPADDALPVLAAPGLTGNTPAEEGPAGFGWETLDRRTSLGIGAFVRPQLAFSVVDGEVDAAGFSVENARLFLTGKARGFIHYWVLAELARPSAPLLDFWFDFRIRQELSVMVGQMKVPFGRSNLAHIHELAFPVRGSAIEGLRPARDIGAMLHGRYGPLYYMAGLYNGAGVNRGNDNVDFQEVVRLEWSMLGEPMSDRLTGNYLYGDFARVRAPHLALGISGLHDLVAVPERIGGLEIDERDADGDGEIDNVRVLSAGADLLFRWLGLEVALEGIFRQERWGTILEHSANAGIDAAVRPNSAGKRNYLGFVGHGHYFLVPRLALGTQASYGQAALLGLSGRNPFPTAPTSDERLDVEGLLQLHDDEGYRWASLGYRYTQYFAVPADVPANAHTLFVEALLRL